MKDINVKINKEFTNIFKTLNEDFFDGCLNVPVFIFGNRFSINSSSTSSLEMIIAEQNTTYKLNLNSDILNKTIEEIAADLCNAMIKYYDSVFSEVLEHRLTSNRGIYTNKYFKEKAEECGLVCRKYSYGFETFAGEKFKKYCKSKGFKKTWKGKYTMCINGKIKRNSSTMKFVCPNGCWKSVRVTSYKHKLFCECGQELLRAE